MSASPDLSTEEIDLYLSNHPDLEGRINDLRKFAEPLSEVVVASPILDVVSKIMGFNDSLQGLEPKEIERIERDVRECERQLQVMSYDTIQSIIAKPKTSRVFRILKNANQFESTLRRAIGKPITVDGQETVITPQIADALTRYRFSIGTPPVTPGALSTVEKIIFGGNLGNIYGYRELLSADHNSRIKFDRFIATLEKLVEQSARYTTAKDKREFEDETTHFSNLEGLRGIVKTTVSGSANTAIRLIKEQLLRHHKNGDQPLKGVKERYNLDDALIRDMQKNKNHIYVVRVDNVEPGTFANDKLQGKWEKVIGRLVIVDNTVNARKSGSTTVYSMHSLVTETIDKFHVKDSGTQANTQMNLRRILENFATTDLAEIRKNIEAQIHVLEEKDIHHLDPDEARKKEWLMSAQSDYLNLKSFLEFLTFIQHIQCTDDSGMSAMNTKLIAENERSTMDYFYSNLRGKGYKCICVPQGGGRREVGLVGGYHLQKNNARVRTFCEDNLEDLKARLNLFKSKHGIDQGSTAIEANALQRSRFDRRGPAHVLRDSSGAVGSISSALRSRLADATHAGLRTITGQLNGLEEKLHQITAANLSGQAGAWAMARLDNAGIGAAGKLIERDLREAGNLVRTATGLADTIAGRVLGIAQGISRAGQAAFEVHPLDLAERMINDLEKGIFRPSLALSNINWTFNDVLQEDDYPSKNYIPMKIDETGQVDPSSLQDYLENVSEQLQDFPELFELYCKSIVLIFNDPHNPTSTVASNDRKLAILRIASQYGLTICSDEAYRKQVTKEKKNLQGDYSLAEFYENNRAYFSGHKPPSIFTSLPTTKWSVGAGKRTGTLMTNEPGDDFERFVKASTDSVNSMSLYMDNRELKAGMLVKRVCKTLEDSFKMEVGDPDQVLDGIIMERFSDLNSDGIIPAVYIALLEARNHLDFLKLRTETGFDYRLHAAQYISKLISQLKNLRLDKITQRDTAERTDAAIAAIQRVAMDHPGLEKRCIKPEGPFYMCVKLDEKGQDHSLVAFLELISRARKIDVVPQAEGYVRFAFGGMVDGTPEGYRLLSLAIETDLRLLLKYWENFKSKRQQFHDASDSNPERSALKALFPGGEGELVKAYHEKKILLDEIASCGEKTRARLTPSHKATVDQYISKIEPDAPAHVVTISEFQCKDTKEFVRSEPFRDLFNHYLLQIQGKIPELKHLKDRQLVAKYGARAFNEKYRSRTFQDNEKTIFAKIAVEIANIWFSQNTIKICVSSNGQDPMAIEAKLSSYIKEFLDVFVPHQMQEQIRIRPTFQAGYRAMNGLKANEKLPLWEKTLIENGQFVEESYPTDHSPEMVTPGKARVPGFERQIYRRDGDGQDAPDSSYFSGRLERFVEVINPKDYVMKMVQVGGVKTLLVVKSSYQHYLADEMRLLPQFQISDVDDIKNLKPDAVSFLGIPSKVMGEDYRLGYFFDTTANGEKVPVSWVDEEQITDYMGYLKKPILTVVNEKVKEKGMLPVHGSALTITFKNGLRKTIVMAGDSGTGKSETIIAMIEQAIGKIGNAQQVEAVELLAGDMLSLFKGEDGQLYMLGTEQGDFMRTTDISEGWQNRFRDLINSGAKTNMNDPKNPRITIKGICDPDTFLSPIRVNMFFNINNYERPPAAGALRETDNAVNLLLQEYVKGYRGEKGTSGDQPNLFASLMFTASESTNEGEKAGILEVVKQYGESLDELIGWGDLKLDKSGKAANATLKFNDIEGEIFKGNQIVRSLFMGKKLAYPAYRTKNAEKNPCEIIDTSFDPQKGTYQALLRFENGETKKVPLTREEIFSKIYQPIASTYCGNPFIDPHGMIDLLTFFGGVMNHGEIVTGSVFTQLKRAGMEFDGPTAAAQAILEFIIKDERVTNRFERQKKDVTRSLIDDYGDILLSDEGTIPLGIMANNLYLFERYESDTIRPVDRQGSTIDLKTTKYHYDPDAKAKSFRPRIITPGVEATISEICKDPEESLANLENLKFTTSSYDRIKCWENKEELIYQILVFDGALRLGYKEDYTLMNGPFVKRAEKIAEAIMANRTSSRAT